MPEWLHLDDFDQADGRPLNTVVAIMREHVANCAQCQDLLSCVDRDKAAIEAYGGTRDKDTREVAMKLVREAGPSDDLYYELVVEPLIRQHLREMFPGKIWKPS